MVSLSQVIEALQEDASRVKVPNEKEIDMNAFLPNGKVRNAQAMTEAWGWHAAMSDSVTNDYKSRILFLYKDQT